MCYDASTSRNAFLIGIASSWVLYHQPIPNAKIFGVFLAYTALMQAFDYIFWTNPPPSTVNKVATKSAAVVNLLLPFVLYLTLVYYKKQVSPLSRSISYLYLIGLLGYLWYNWSRIIETKVTPRSSPSLDWEWTHLSYSSIGAIVYLLTMLLMISVEITGSIKYLLIALVSLTYWFSYQKHHLAQTSGRFWCYFGAFYPLVILGYIFVSSKIKNKLE